MSRQNKMAGKRKHRIPHAKFNTGTHKVEATGQKGPRRTQKIHTKRQIYPKTILLGKWQWKWAGQ